MSIDNVQLKQEEVVGSEIVLQDIYPKTSTESVTDSSTGVQMDVTLDRIWNAINKKLSRIVNSVNGRTGVVVLNADDVGLGKVDNVSFSDIKEWVINKLKVEFGNKRLKLFNNLTELQTLIDSNDEIYRDTPFFSETGFGDDKRAYIGYIWMDEGKNELTYDCVAINTIGYTDNSIIYDEKLDNDKDFSGGGLGVNIWKYEDALQLYNGLSKSESGLRIDKSKIVCDLYHFDGVYGDGTSGDTNALLYFENIPTNPTPSTVKIFIDENQVVYSLKIRQSFKKGDMIICCFKNYKNTDGSIPTGMCPSLMYRNPCIGQVTQAPTDDTPNDDYIIKFYSIKPNVGLGLKYGINHRDGVHDTELMLAIARGGITEIKRPEGDITFDNPTPYTGNVSGLQVIATDSHPNLRNFSENVSIPDGARITVLPIGPTKVFDSSGGGLHISPDISMCVMPYSVFGKNTHNPHGGSIKNDYYGSKMVSNWTIPHTEDLSDDLEPFGTVNEHNGLGAGPGFIGVNLNKFVKKLDQPIEGFEQFAFLNISGLRLTGYNGTETGGSSYFGIKEGDYTGKIALDQPMSGGLSVNVGKFLEIGPGEDYPTNMDDFYDTGKVNVRIGKGLKDDGNNRISLDISQPNALYIDSNAGLRLNLREYSGLGFDTVNASGSLFVALATNGGLVYDSSITDKDGIGCQHPIKVAARPLTFVHGSKTAVYHPLACETSISSITLGPGLKLED